MTGFQYMGGLEAGLWIDAILNDTELYVTADQAVVVTEILDAIYSFIADRIVSSMSAVALGSRRSARGPWCP